MKSSLFLSLILVSCAFAQDQSLENYINSLPKYDAPGKDYPGRKTTAEPKVFIRPDKDSISPETQRNNQIDLNKKIKIQDTTTSSDATNVNPDKDIQKEIQRSPKVDNPSDKNIAY